MEEKLDIQTRPYQEGDEKYLSAILEKIYHRNFNDEYWRWKYLDNPLGTHFCHCALMEGRIIGFAGGIPYRIKWKDREIMAAQITDLVVEPELQGKKVFSPLQKANLADIRNKTDAFYGFTNENSYRVYYKKEEDFDYSFHVPRMIKILNATAFLKHRLPAAAAKIAGTVADIGLSLAERMMSVGAGSATAIREIKTFDERFDVFMKMISPSFNMMHVRDQRYLNWRYCHHPLYRYTIYAAEEAGDILGFVVLRNEPAEVHRGFILEFFAFPDRNDVQHLLLNQAAEHFRRLGVDIVTCWMFPHSIYYKAFKRHLFLSRRGDLIALATVSKKNDELKADINNPLRWYVSCGDHETL